MEPFKLGQTTQYSSKYDSSLIDVFPRESRRTGMTAPMFGLDVWTCYEFSFLHENGCPWFGVIRIFNPATSTHIFESKSLKLYLGSFNNTFFKNIHHALAVIQYDLSQKVGSPVLAQEVQEFPQEKMAVSLCLDSLEDRGISEYEYNPDLLGTIRYPQPVVRRYHSNLLRSNCEVTGQPDWGRVTIIVLSENVLKPYELLQYIVSFRNHKGFHEVVCETIYNDLYKVLQSPIGLTVLCQYTRRGGIDINPYRQNSDSVDMTMFTKLIQQ